MFARAALWRKAWMTLLCGAWLPVVVTCQPPDGTVVVSDWWWDGTVYVEDCCWDEDIEIDVDDDDFEIDFDD